MKELSIEEKANRYDELLVKAKQIYNKENDVLIIHTVEDLFPELKESEDEKIRQFLIRKIEGTSDEIMSYRSMNKKDVLTWLEKQGEHANFRNKIQIGDKVTRNEDGVLVNLSQLNRVAKKDEKQGKQNPNKVEPKFKVGDWIIFDEHHNSVYQVEKIQDLRYYLRHYTGSSMSVHINNQLIRRWSIQDAKPGDVLCCESGWTCLFKALDNHTNTFSSYCFMDSDKWFCETGSESHTLDKAFIKAYNGNIYPATKEQRDLLFSKMKESGYEWNAEKKVLKKIEQKTTDKKGMNLVEEKMTPFQKKVFCIIDTAIEEEQGLKQVCDELLSLAYDEIMQKPAWSEEDEQYVKDTLALLAFGASIHTISQVQNWLKSLKDKVQPQPKQEWNEEDEEMYKEVLTDIIYAKNDLKVKECLGLSKRAMKAFNWFSKRYKSLKPQNWTKEDKERYISCLQRLGTGNPEQPETINSKWFKEHVYPQSTWKPSDEQMTYIQDAISKYNEFSNEYMDLVKLYNDLKKLREE